jgi:hypothetical protein
MSIIKTYEKFIDSGLISIFENLKSKWWEETSLSSNPNDIYNNKYYKEIISLGEKIIPILIKDLDTANGDWFEALYEITKINPVKKENIGYVKKMSDDWKNWYGNI